MRLRVEEEQHHVGPANGALGAGDAVELDGVVQALFLRTPAVSMAVNVRPSRSKRTSTLSRVVPGTSLTIMRSLSARLLMNVLLPVLRRPTMASFSAAFFGAASSASGGRQSFADQVEQLVPVAVLLALTQTSLPSRLVELGGLRVDLRVSHLLATQTIGLLMYRSRRATSSSSGTTPARPSTTNSMTWAKSRAAQSDVRVLGEVIHVGDADAAGVHQLDERRRS